MSTARASGVAPIASRQAAAAASTGLRMEFSGRRHAAAASLPTARRFRDGQRADLLPAPKPDSPQGSLF
jgi:hypothetical protein